MTSISPSSTCKDYATSLQQNATPTDSRETPCLKSNHSRGNSTNASFTIADQIAPYVRALSSLDQDALVETIQQMLVVASAEAFTNYELSFTAAATALAEINDKVTAIAAASALDQEPQLQYSRKDAARMLGMSLHSVADYIKVGLLKARHEGGSVKILRTELLRFVKSDCRKPMASKKKLLQMGVKQSAFAELKVG